jgi:hypothetical protein
MRLDRSHKRTPEEKRTRGPTNCILTVP